MNKADRGLWKKLNWKTAINTEINRKKTFYRRKDRQTKKRQRQVQGGNAVKFLLNNASPQEGTRKDKQSITKNKKINNFSIVPDQSGCLENLEARDVII